MKWLTAIAAARLMAARLDMDGALMAACLIAAVLVGMDGMDGLATAHITPAIALGLAVRHADIP